MPTSIEKFLEQYSHMITQEDDARLREIHQKIIELQQKTFVINKHGRHYDDCVWASEQFTRAVVRCKCSLYHIDNELAKAKNIMECYFLLFSRIYSNY
ncbi:hypothetical protein [Drosophila suzukii associated hytrosavirus 1]|nr:hypothetical protein [Drosophila suzukii associated hytrosavirus 1]